MDIKEVRKIKKQLEDDLGSIISEKLREFVDKTGIEVCGISINLTSIHEFGMHKTSYLVGDVYCRLDI